MSFGTRRVRAGLLVAAVLAALLLPLPLSPFFRQILNFAVISAMVVLGLNFVLGYAGQLSLAQAAFWGIGAYTSALLTVDGGWPVVGAFCAATIVAATAGVALGLPTLRLRGHYLAMATIGFGILAQLILVHWRNITRGPDGIPDIPGLSIGAVPLRTEEQRYYLLLVVYVAMAGVAWRIRQMRIGRAFVAIRENELAGEILGIDTTRYKVLAFALAAAYAGAAGSLYAHLSQFISPDTYSLEQSVQFLAMLVLGGAGSIAGATVGSLLLTCLPFLLQFLHLPPGAYLAVYGAAIMLTMVFLPGGLISLLDRLDRRPVVQPRPRVAALPWAAPATDDSAGESLLETRGLVKAFGGVHAVDGLDLLVRPGAIHALIGPNGSGKTTTLNVLNGISAASAGTVMFAGHDVTRLPPHRRAELGLSRTFQSPRLFWSLSVLENVVIGTHPRSRVGVGSALLRSRAALQERLVWAEARQVLACVGLSGCEDVAARNLPYGAQRLLEIARALASRPRLLLLDEPAAGLNPAETEALIVLLERIRESGVTLLLIEHDMNLVMALSDRVTVLNFGQKIGEGPPGLVAGDDQVIEAYLGREEEVPVGTVAPPAPGSGEPARA